MKTQKLLIAIILVLMLSGISIAAAKACPTQSCNQPQCNYSSSNNCFQCLNLPQSSVTLTITSGAYVVPITIVLSHVPSGYTVTSQTYNGFCIDLLTTINNYKAYSATLESSLCKSTTWNEINFILNHQNQGTPQDVQAAIWLIEGYNTQQISTYGQITVTSNAQTLYCEAKAFGRCFTPCAGQEVAIICHVPGSQTTIIEICMPHCYYNYGYCYYGGCGYKQGCNEYWSFCNGYDIDSCGYNGYCH